MAARPRGPALPPPAPVRRPGADLGRPRLGRRRGRPSAPIEYETDRARFLGRGRTPADPAALDPGATLSGTTGPVLDPIFSLRRRVRLEPGASAVVAFTTAVADSRDEALALADQYHDRGAVARAFELAWAHSQVEHRHRELVARGRPPVPAAGGAHPLRRPGPAGRPAPCWPANRQGQPASGGTASRATGRSSWSAIAERRRAAPGPPAARRRTPTSASRGSSSTWSSSTSSRRATSRSCTSSSWTWSAPATPATWSTSPGGVFVRKAGADRPRRTRSCSRPRPASSSSATAARSPASSTASSGCAALPDAPGRDAATGPLGRRPRSRAARPTCSSPTASAASRPTAANTACSSAPPRAPTSAATATAARPGRRPAGPAAGPLDQRRRQPVVRLPRLRGRVGLHLGRQQPDEPPDPLEQRPGLRPARRGRLPARRGDRRGLVADAPARPRRRRPTVVRHGQGYTIFERHAPRPRPRADPVRPARRPGQADPPEGRATPATGRAGSRRRSTPSGCWARPATPPPMHVVTEVDPETGALLARNPFHADFAGAGRLRRRRPPARGR